MRLEVSKSLMIFVKKVLPAVFGISHDYTNSRRYINMPTSVNALSSIIHVFREGDGTYFNKIIYGTRRTVPAYRQPYLALNVQGSSDKNEKILALLPDGLGEHIILNTNTKADERYKYSYWRT